MQDLKKETEIILKLKKELQDNIKKLNKYGITLEDILQELGGIDNEQFN